MSPRNFIAPPKVISRLDLEDREEGLNYRIMAMTVANKVVGNQPSMLFSFYLNCANRLAPALTVVEAATGISSNKVSEVRNALHHAGLIYYSRRDRYISILWDNIIKGYDAIMDGSFTEEKWTSIVDGMGEPEIDFEAVYRDALTPEAFRGIHDVRELVPPMTKERRRELFPDWDPGYELPFELGRSRTLAPPTQFGELRLLSNAIGGAGVVTHNGDPFEDTMELCEAFGRMTEEAYQAFCERIKNRTVGVQYKDGVMVR